MNFKNCFHPSTKIVRWKKAFEHFICPVPFLPVTESQFEKKLKDFFLKLQFIFHIYYTKIFFEVLQREKINWRTSVEFNKIFFNTKIKVYFQNAVIFFGKIFLKHVHCSCIYSNRRESYFKFVTNNILFSVF